MRLDWKFLRPTLPQPFAEMSFVVSPATATSWSVSCPGFVRGLAARPPFPASQHILDQVHLGLCGYGVDGVVEVGISVHAGALGVVPGAAGGHREAIAVRVMYTVRAVWHRRGGGSLQTWTVISTLFGGRNCLQALPKSSM